MIIANENLNKIRSFKRKNTIMRKKLMNLFRIQIEFNSLGKAKKQQRKN